MPYVQWALWALGLSLQFLVISSLLKGLYKKFPFVFSYTVILFFTTVIEIAAFLNAADARMAARYYWVNDLVLQSLVYAIVITLIYRALSPEKRARAGRWLIGLAVLIAIISALAHRDELLSLWMTKLSRDLNFTAAILDLMLWFILLAARRKNYLLLMMSGALGIQFTGAAIGQSLRYLTPRTTMLGNLVLVFSHFLCLFIWWRAFRREGMTISAHRTNA
jgi:hypothetical protein